MKIGYLGPRGTFTEKAVRVFQLEGDMVQFPTIQDVLLAINNDIVQAGIVPIQNSIEGIVNVTIDTLIFDTNIYIDRQLILPIEHCLMKNKNNNNDKIDKIFSHPQALAQCRGFLKKNYPNAEQIETSSTAQAASMISESSDNVASISIDICAEIYDLNIIERNIQDRNNNKTYFIMVSKKETTKPEVNKKMSIAFSTTHRPGELYRILDIFSLWDINITQISSRPMRNTDGKYVFFIDIEIKNNDIDVKDALIMVKRKTDFFKILGTYDTILG